MEYSENDLAILKKISICMEQKLLFMTNILNLTKQIELSVTQDEVAFGNIFEQRQDNMNRIDKCTSLIEASAEQLSEHLKSPLKLCLQGDPCSGNDMLIPIAVMVGKFNAMLSSTRALDATAMSAFKERYSEFRDKLNAIRKNNQTKNGSKPTSPQFHTL